MKKNGLITVALITVMSLSSISSVYAGDWKSDDKGWWWQEDNGTYPVSTWKEINGKHYYFGSDGYMLANTTTPDGYKVGADGAWIQENSNTSQFKLKEQVTWAMNAANSSYEELMAGLQNANSEWVGGSFSQSNPERSTDYKITASNIPFYVTWVFKGQNTYMGEFLGWQPMDGGTETPYKFQNINGTINQIFDGLNKEVYTVAEFEALVKQLNATNIESVDKDEIRYLPGFNGVTTGRNYTEHQSYITFNIDKYKFLIDADTNLQRNDNKVFRINETKVNISLSE